ncbi:hypothetical protein GUITHDRAFT_132456 [Guillardia theta CCMP2712]|uniref:Fcf2 pre-rRNA processing C-terminal domain-containing protein n=1 Tax=Guillardia theta (strain CCMP2712) TaxID=905079 RepID=L1JZL6_GUITC|nr:hypothetical protein GUITHDRAFT_132456 [Guillardia theta CCMP2712]EKX54041.1 hypothetical protein GUITHDRAFT_132456 [Guillardia theta CCMP2712]|eukprot:XP_005841021.1 hypothetical protein GUITHDRAFT_132456 [Guillardia theta CCMP2712]
MTKTWRRSWVCSSLFLVLILVPSRSFSWVNHETNTCRQANPRATVAPALLKLRGGKGRKKRGASSSEDKESSDGWASGEDSPSTSEEEKKKQAEPRGIPRRRGDRRSDSSDVGKASSDSGSSWEEGSERSEKSSQSTLSEDGVSTTQRCTDSIHPKLPEDVMERITWRGQEIDPEDEYIDFFKYRVKWCPDKLDALSLNQSSLSVYCCRKFLRRQEQHRKLQPWMSHATKEGCLRLLEQVFKRYTDGKDENGRFDLPKGPDLKSRPDLRADFKLLTERNTWDPKNRYKSLGWEKKGTTTKSPTKLEYPKYFAEGYYAIDPKHPWENLPKHLRFKSLTEQIMADDRIRRKIKERFHRQQKLAAEEKKLKGLTEKPTRPPRPPRPVRTSHTLPAPDLNMKATGRSIMIQKSLKKIRAVQREGYDGEGPDPLADRELPKMPSMGGTGSPGAFEVTLLTPHTPGKPPTEEEIREERMQRLETSVVEARHWETRWRAAIKEEINFNQLSLRTVWLVVSHKVGKSTWQDKSDHYSTHLTTQ